MNKQAIWGITLRHLYLLRHDVNRWINLFFWPLVNVIIWGTMGIWIQRNSQSPHIQLTMLTGIILWEIVNKSTNELSLTLLEELWSSNLVNLFASPLRFSEWLIGSIYYAGISVLFLIVYVFIIIALLYPSSLGSVALSLLIFSLPLFISGLFLGFISMSFIITLGKRAGEIAYITAWLAAPFCGVFYPREILPLWAQHIGSWIPMTWIIEGMRSYLTHGSNPFMNIIIGCCMGIIYDTIALILLAYLFKKSKKHGLNRLSD